jgi:hypothetical protein
MDAGPCPGESQPDQKVPPPLPCRNQTNAKTYEREKRSKIHPSEDIVRQIALPSLHFGCHPSIRIPEALLVNNPASFDAIVGKGR